jgi:hypothetical protein
LKIIANRVYGLSAFIGFFRFFCVSKKDFVFPVCSGFAGLGGIDGT